MKIYCSTYSPYFETNLRVFKKYVGKDIWVMCVFNEHPELGKLVKIINISDFSDTGGLIIFDYQDVGIALDSWGNLTLPEALIDYDIDIKEQLNKTTFGLVDVFSEHYHVCIPEELYSTDELLEMFEA